ncbi:hypothetical protein NNJEOMEG_01500 [Fundidesulfovibrio magnetotacticus]|uniref:Uncharacterized protein n=1 Tax=Fundidesulfovibrio magnetotacticus TaxID=2730080 RepID=A0A6V8LV17_9BACT|nr:hypothetical protein [Fundidesulfovibrio magnetotacticus]GFK93666.1 hypothetical protein NNJEOMEG_01500 [Fundidesulfovibrio magnetotacticus]
MDDNDYRVTFRIEVDETIVLELAVWLRRANQLGRVHLRDLGDPKMAQGRPPFPRIEDISSTGMCLSFKSSQLVEVEKFAGVAVLVYFKLVDPTDMMGDPLSFMAGFEVKHAQHHGDRTFLGLKLRWDGVPDQNDKALYFADAAKYGIADLTKWCDEMNRKVCGMEHMPPQGLRLDRLLREVEAARKPLGQACPTR